MTLDYLQIFRDKRELLEPFTREEKGELLEAMLAYAFDGAEISLETNARYIWPVFRKMIDQSKKAFEAKSNAGKRKPQQAESDGNQNESNAIRHASNAIRRVSNAIRRVSNAIRRNQKPTG